MEADHTIRWWQRGARRCFQRWLYGIQPHPNTYPQPVDVDRLVTPPGVSLPAPVASGLALDAYSRGRLVRRRTPAGVEMFRFKYRGDLDAGWRLVRAAAEFLAHRWEMSAIEFLLAAPHGLEYRPFYPVDWLTARLAEVLEVPAIKNGFSFTRLAVKQKHLWTVADKQRNVTGLFRLTQNARRKIAGKPVLLIDDLCNSGYTLAELRRTLIAAGSGKVFLFAFVRTGRSGGKERSE